MKVLLICHAFAPHRGSEPGFSWNWATSLSRYHDLWVLAHPEFRAEVDAELAMHPNPRLHLVWLKGTDWDPAKGQAGVELHYVRWLQQAQRLGRTLHAETGFDLVHHISLGTISVPPDFWKLGLPFVWGPLGGGQTCPPRLRGLFGSQQWQEWLRPVRLGLLRWYPPLRAAVRHSAAVLAVNHETRRFLESIGVDEVPMFWDSGVSDEALPAAPRVRPAASRVRILWASRFQKRKALPLALEAMAQLRDRTGPEFELVVAGGGYEAEPWRALTRAMRLEDSVQFLGELQPTQMHQQFQRADIFLFTSVRDSFGTVVLEAMTHGVPVVALDIHGVGARMPPEAGVKVPAGSRAQTVRGLADAVERLAADPALRHAMGTAGWRYAATQVWSARAAEMDAIYRRVVAPAPAAGAVTPAERQGIPVQP